MYAYIQIFIFKFFCASENMKCYDLEHLKNVEKKTAEQLLSNISFIGLIVDILATKKKNIFMSRTEETDVCRFRHIRVEIYTVYRWHCDRETGRLMNAAHGYR